MDLEYRSGDSKRILHVVTLSTAGTVLSPTIAVYDSTQTAVVPAGTPGGASPGAVAALEHDVYYLWTPAAAGDYTYLLRYTAGSETRSIRGVAYVYPVVSKYDRWIEAVKGLMQEHDSGESLSLLSYRDYMRVMDAARRAYEADRPRVVARDLALTAADWEYALSDLATGITPAAAWIDGLSDILGIEPDLDATIQSRAYLPALDWTVDPTRSVLRFETRSPATGDVARIHWTTVHTLSHTVDSLPADTHPHASLIAKYAAGEALSALAAQASHTEAPQYGSDIVSYRDKEQRYSSQAKRLKDEARAMWRGQTFYI